VRGPAAMALQRRPSGSFRAAACSCRCVPDPSPLPSISHSIALPFQHLSADRHRLQAQLSRTQPRRRCAMHAGQPRLDDGGPHSCAGRGLVVYAGVVLIGAAAQRVASVAGRRGKAEGAHFMLSPLCAEQCVLSCLRVVNSGSVFCRAGIAVCRERFHLSPSSVLFTRTANPRLTCTESAACRLASVHGCRRSSSARRSWPTPSPSLVRCCVKQSASLQPAMPFDEQMLIRTRRASRSLASLQLEASGGALK